MAAKPEFRAGPFPVRASGRLRVTTLTCRSSAESRSRMAGVESVLASSTHQMRANGWLLTSARTVVSITAASSRQGMTRCQERMLASPDRSGRRRR